MTNREKLKKLLLEVFLLAETAFRWDLKQEEVADWDSLGMVSMAVGVQETFGCYFTPEEATSIRSFEDLIRILVTKGIQLD